MALEQPVRPRLEQSATPEAEPSQRHRRLAKYHRLPHHASDHDVTLNPKGAVVSRPAGLSSTGCRSSRTTLPARITCWQQWGQRHAASKNPSAPTRRTKADWQPDSLPDLATSPPAATRISRAWKRSLGQLHTLLDSFRALAPLGTVLHQDGGQGGRPGAFLIKRWN